MSDIWIGCRPSGNSGFFIAHQFAHPEHEEPPEKYRLPQYRLVDLIHVYHPLEGTQISQ